MSDYPYNLPEDHPDRRMELDYQQAMEAEERDRNNPMSETTSQLRAALELRPKSIDYKTTELWLRDLHNWEREIVLIVPGLLDHITAQAEQIRKLEQP